ncbi:hypothetical protein FGIG_03678 [Fasciola gigantica]|uniref:Uncharacterized protein n=1 Tax=Fasciola gigantica TaxID=46835 RepID=A0A504ZBB7_FASGI|nr:hypothetical protein FGIG_03678 [Fasciola gigantica]
MLLFQFLVVCLYLDSFVLTNPISREEKPYSIFRNGSASTDHGKPLDFRGIRIRRDTEEANITPDNSEETSNATGENDSPLVSTEEDSDTPSEQQEIPLVVRNNEPPDDSDASDEHTVDDGENQSVPGKVDTVITPRNEESTASPSYFGEMVDEDNQLSEKSNEQDSTNFQDDQDAAHSTNTISASQNDPSSDNVNAGDIPANQADNLLPEQSEISLDLTESPVDVFQSTSEGDSSAPSLDEFEIHELTEERSTDADGSSPQLNAITEADEPTVEDENQTDNDEASNENTHMDSITLTSNELEYQAGDDTASNMDSTESEQVQSETNPDSDALGFIEKESQLVDALPNTEELVDQPVAEQQSNENEHQELDRQSEDANERPKSSFSEPQGSLEEGENLGALSNAHTEEQMINVSETDSISLSDENNDQRTDVIKETEGSHQQPTQEEPYQQQQQQRTDEQNLNEAKHGDDSQENEKQPETSSEDHNSENVEGKTKREQESGTSRHQTHSNGKYEPNHGEPEVETEPETLPESSSHESLSNIISSESEEVPDDQQTNLTQETTGNSQEESHDDSQQGQQQEEEAEGQQQQTAGEQDQIESETTSTDQEQYQPETSPEQSGDINSHNTPQQEHDSDSSRSELVSNTNEQPEPNHGEPEVETEPETLPESSSHESLSNIISSESEEVPDDQQTNLTQETTGNSQEESHDDSQQGQQQEEEAEGQQQQTAGEQDQIESETTSTDQEQYQPETSPEQSGDINSHNTPQQEHDSDSSRSELVSNTNELPDPNPIELHVEKSEEVPDDQQTNLTQETTGNSQEESHDDSQQGQQQEEEAEGQQQQTAGEQDQIESETTSTDQEQYQPETSPEQSGDINSHNTPQQEHDSDSSRSELVSNTNEQPEPNHGEPEVETEPETLPESSSHESLSNIISSESEEVPDDQQTNLTQETTGNSQEESHDDSQQGQQQEEEAEGQQQQTAGEQDQIESETTSTDQEQYQPETSPEQSGDINSHNTPQQEHDSDSSRSELVSNTNELPDPNPIELHVESNPESPSNGNDPDSESTVVYTNSLSPLEETGVQDSKPFERHTGDFQSAQNNFQQRLTEEEHQSESETKNEKLEQEKPATEKSVSSELPTEFTDFEGQPESESDVSHLNYHTETSPEQNAPEQALHISDTDSETSSGVQRSQETFSDKSHEASYETEPGEPLPANGNKNNIPTEKLTEKEPEEFNPYSIESMDQSTQKVDSEEQQERLVGEHPEQVDDSTLLTPGGSENIDESTGARDTEEIQLPHEGGSQGNHIKQAEETVNLIQNSSTNQDVAPPSTYNRHESFVPQLPQWVDPSQVQSNEHGRADVKPINPHGNESSEEQNSTENPIIPSWSEINSRGREQPDAEVTNQEQLRNAHNTETVHNSNKTEDPDQDESKNQAESKSGTIIISRTWISVSLVVVSLTNSILS